MKPTLQKSANYVSNCCRSRCACVCWWWHSSCALSAGLAHLMISGNYNNLMWILSLSVKLVKYFFRNYILTNLLILQSYGFFYKSKNLKNLVIKGLYYLDKEKMISLIKCVLTSMNPRVGNLLICFFEQIAHFLWAKELKSDLLTVTLL